MEGVGGDMRTTRMTQRTLTVGVLLHQNSSAHRARALVLAVPVLSAGAAGKQSRVLSSPCLAFESFRQRLPTLGADVVLFTLDFPLLALPRLAAQIAEDHGKPSLA
jgi:hypothetical protein